MKLNFKLNLREAALVVAAILGTTCATGGATGGAFAQSPGVPWPVVEGLNREICDESTAPKLRENKTVGIFYFLWLDPTTTIPSDPNRSPNDVGPYDLSKILAKDSEAVRRQDDSLLGKNGEMHFWGEPLFGYYDSRDPWVVRRHMALLADAGVDVLIFDTTNAVTYPHVYLPLCDLLLQMKAEGDAVPQVAFMTNTQVGPTTQKLWDEFYSQEKYAPLFFKWNGKPLVLSDPAQVPEALRDKFTLRTAYWPTGGMKNTQNAWHWVAAFPQPFAWSENENVPEQINVSPSQNLARDAKADAVWMSRETARGRSFVVGSPTLGQTEFLPSIGLNYARQTERALEVDPPFVMITGWNEWIAGRWKQGDSYIFVDQFNQEYSRDLEPTRGLHFDNYYLQTVDFIRRYKGAPRLPLRNAASKKIAFDADFDRWNAVEPTLRDHRNETIPRDFTGVGGTYYKNDSGRNDILVSKLGSDNDNYYFYLETREPIRPEIPNGLCLGIDFSAKTANNEGRGTGWRGVDLLIGREYSADGTVRAELYDDETAAKNAPSESGETTGAWITKARVDGVRWKLDGNKLMLAVPRKLIRGVPAFKWFDNIPFESPADLYEKGDVAPESSFFYRVR